MLLTLLCLLEKLFYMNLLLVHVKLLLMMMIIIIFGHSDNYVMETQAIDYQVIFVIGLFQCVVFCFPSLAFALRIAPA